MAGEPEELSHERSFRHRKSISFIAVALSLRKGAVLAVGELKKKTRQNKASKLGEGMVTSLRQRRWRRRRERVKKC